MYRRTQSRRTDDRGRSTEKRTTKYSLFLMGTTDIPSQRSLSLQSSDDHQLVAASTTEHRHVAAIMMNLVFAVLFRLSVNIYLRLIPFQFLSLYVIPVLFAITLRGQLRKPTESFQPAGAIAAMEREEENEKRKMEKEKLLAEEAAVEGAEGSASATAPSVASPPRDPTVIGSIVLPFLTGSRSSTSSKINLMSIVVNTLLFLFVLDAQWRPVLFMPETELQFVRVGSVDHQSCRISGRFPPVQSRSNDGSESSTATWEEEGATLKYRLAKPGSKGKWILAGVMEGSEESDWMSDLLIEGLYSSTDYECTFDGLHALSSHDSLGRCLIK